MLSRQDGAVSSYSSAAGHAETRPDARVPAIETRGITKRFGPVEVLTDIDLVLYGGRIHSLAGENGAGKSTLVKILAGIYRPDNGMILLDGQPITMHSAADAGRHGIAVIHQHPAMFPDLSVAENIFIGRQPRRGSRIDWARMQATADDRLQRLGMQIDVRLPVKAISIVERQVIEIVRALSLDAHVLIMDEPTSTISAREIDRLFEIARRLKQRGIAILFISHFIDEVLGLGDDVTILRSGRKVISCPAATLTPEQTVRHMIGSDPSTLFPKQAGTIGRTVLGARHLSGAGFVNDVSFDLKAGEILGLFGLVGAGRSEVAHMLFGISRPDQGEILIDGTSVKPRSPRDAMQFGISLLPEDRHQQGLVLQFPIRANETLPILRRLANRFGLVDGAKEARLARAVTGQMRVVAHGIEQLTSTLSGGNQQKVLLAKWLLPAPRVLILDQPTRGIDVGAKAEIHRIVSSLAAQGVAIILISDDAPEVIAMADRILVLRTGRLVGAFTHDAVDQQALMLAAAHSAADRNAKADVPR